MIQKMNKKGVYFMVNMVYFVYVYAGSLAPYGFVG